MLSLKDTTVSYALDEIPMWDRFAQIKGQALIGYCFRSSKAGEVTALGILLPGQGYSHNVSLWDSVTYQVLADVNVPNLNTKKFTYVSLALLNKSVDIQPNHPYIVCFNSLAQGSPLNFASRGNNIYQLHAEILNPFVATTPLVIPFTSGAITFESDFIVTYNSIYVPNPALVGESTNDQRVFGICDIGFMSK
ncbi:MAG: DUF4082 domain-containing protein [Bacteroidetes bacterium]|nr:DUF4082 domain-containing protein [Bacteroidota bacterium]